MTETRMLASGWYFHRQGSPAGQRTGPVSWGQLYGYAQQGIIRRRDLVWNERLPDWVRASEIPGLFGSRAPVLAWLLPLLAVIVVGAGLGTYLGLIHDWGGSSPTGGFATSGVVTANAEANVVVAEDGASVTFPAFGGVPGPDATLTRVMAPSGEVVDGAMMVSGEYVLRVADASTVGGDVIVWLPLETDLLPADWDPAGLTPKALNLSSGQWERVGQVVGYDEATSQVMFDAPFASCAGATGEDVVAGSGRLTGVWAPAAFSAGRVALDPAVLAQTGGAAEGRYRIEFEYDEEVAIFVLSDQHSFEVAWYHTEPPGSSSGVPSDDAWRAGQPWMIAPDVPNYVEDLQQALEKGYAGLLQIQSGAGGPLFTPLGEAKTVWVTNTWNVQGTTNLAFETVHISGSRIADYEELEQVATHELVHLLSAVSGHYGSRAAAANRWFFEATAEYLAARARGLSADERGKHYSSPSVITDVYLSIPLTSANVSSYYAAAHFLDWCSVRYGDSLVPTVVASGTSPRNDLALLSDALVAHGEPGGIGAAYGAYIRDLVTRPADFGKANIHFKTNITLYAKDQGHASGAELNEQCTYVRLARTLGPLSTTGVFLQGRNKSAGLLVIDTDASDGGSLQATTYDFATATNADYQSSAAVDAGLAFPYPQPVTVADFGGQKSAGSHRKQLQQLIANTSTTETAHVDVIYYLLLAPRVLSVEDGAVAWSTAELGNLARGFIEGYHVYKDGVRLTSSMVPVPDEGTSDLRFASDQIKAGDTIVVQVVDQSGNAWPQVSPTQQSSTTTTTNPLVSMVVGTWQSVGEIYYYVMLDEYYYSVRTLVMSAAGTCTWEDAPVLVAKESVDQQAVSPIINSNSSPPEYEYYTGTYQVGAATFSDGTIWLDDGGQPLPETFGLSDDGRELYFQSTVLKRK